MTIAATRLTRKIMVDIIAGNAASIANEGNGESIANISFLINLKSILFVKPWIK